MLPPQLQKGTDLGVPPTQFGEPLGVATDVGVAKRIGDLGELDLEVGEQFDEYGYVLSLYRMNADRVKLLDY